MPPRLIDNLEEMTLINAITEKIIGCAFKVSNTLGYGFLEKVYENALAHEIRKTGLEVTQQAELDVTYDGVPVGHFYADMLVANKVLIEVKVARELDEVHVAQCLNNLRATGLQLCLLINFGKKRAQIERVVQ